MDDEVTGIKVDLVDAAGRSMPLPIARSTCDPDAVALVLPADTGHRLDRVLGDRP